MFSVIVELERNERSARDKELDSIEERFEEEDDDGAVSVELEPTRRMVGRDELFWRSLKDGNGPNPPTVKGAQFVTLRRCFRVDLG